MDKTTEPQYIPAENPEDHPWLDIPGSSLDEDLRFTLDEIRFT